jgi:hypothetical protein
MREQFANYFKVRNIRTHVRRLSEKTIDSSGFLILGKTPAERSLVSSAKDPKIFCCRAAKPIDEESRTSVWSVDFIGRFVSFF